ncbi:hypothetical protein Tco_0147285, partial [Tanacetum coccineum]
HEPEYLEYMVPSNAEAPIEDQSLPDDTWYLLFYTYLLPCTDIKEMNKRKDKTRQNRARDRKEREKTSSMVPSDFIGPARNPFYGPGQSNILLD